jgi:hypothetical protein
MTSIPADAPRSDDGFYWWDGTQWQPVQEGSQSTAAQTEELPEQLELIHTWGSHQVGETDVPEMSDEE